MVDNKSKIFFVRLMQKKMMKINKLTLMLHTHMIVLSLFVIYFNVCHLGSPIVLHYWIS